MNMVIGSVSSILLSGLSLCSIIPRYIYGSGDMKETGEIMITVKNDKKDFFIINKSIKTIGVDKNNNIVLLVPRYKPFIDILIDLANSDVEIVNIAGNEYIQVKMDIWLNKLELIHKYQYLGKNYWYYRISVKELGNILKNYRNNVHHIFDY